ncbi:hypothetical protein Br6_04985 [Rhodococcus sp. Br-6]|nr:hypothetical protein Br6_04985 [Rhodococcus sp. Br-6]
MTTLASGTRRLSASVIAAAAAVTMLAGCSTDSPGAQVTSGSDESPTYTDQFTVGSATISTNLPDGTRVFQLDGDEARLTGHPDGSALLVSWPGHDLSSQSITDLVTNPPAGQENFMAESVRIQLWPIDCAAFEGFRSKDDTIDTTSPLTSQPLSYTRFSMTDPKQKRSNSTSWKDPDLNSFYALEFVEQPCTGVMAVESYMTTSASNPLKDFGYRLFVEGDGTVTTTNP